MLRRLALVTVVVLAPGVVWAEEKIPTGPPPTTLADVERAPGDVKVLNRYIGTQFREIGRLIDVDLAAAKARLEAFATTLAGLPGEGDAAEARERAESSVEFYRERIDVAPLTAEELEKAALASPDDEKTFNRWANKAFNAVGGLAYSRPDQAQEKLAAVKAVVEKVAAAASEEQTKKRLAAYSDPRGAFATLENAIAKGRKYADLVGKDAAPLDVASWVNGQPLSAEDLQGKVVLLDFWAIWCGPCIATLPHLREWHEKYGEKGLIMVGLTRNYQYRWDETLGYCAKAEKGEEVTPEEEREMLEKFADYYHLQHRFAIQDGKELSDYYGVSGIPHVVVIDQLGKIRLVRVGSGKQNAEDIGNLLAELLK
jgi:thiol-disulfide isomerase/thioredoxin